MISARLSGFDPNYYVIYLDGRPWRVCHKNDLMDRYPDVFVDDF